DPGHQGSVAGALGEGLDDRAVGDVARLHIAVRGGNHLHIVEIGPPFFRNGARIIEVALVEFFDIRGITAEQIGVRLERLHHERFTFCNEFLVDEAWNPSISGLQTDGPASGPPCPRYAIPGATSLKFLSERHQGYSCSMTAASLPLWFRGIGRDQIAPTGLERCPVATTASPARSMTRSRRARSAEKDGFGRH